MRFDTAGIRYRGYYYDAETGFYYVSSRYYDPEVGRFLNADTTDVLTASTTALTDKNLYAYCDNNPVVRKDTGGDYWETAFDVASWVVTASETLADPTNPWNWVALARDTIDLATPIGGIGEAIKAYKAANRASDTISAAKKVNNGLSVAKKVYGNSLKSTKVNYGYALVNKNNEIMKFGETINPARRYTKKYLGKNGYKMKIVEFGSKEYIHKW